MLSSNSDSRSLLSGICNLRKISVNAFTSWFGSTPWGVSNCCTVVNSVDNLKQYERGGKLH